MTAHDQFSPSVFPGGRPGQVRPPQLDVHAEPANLHVDVLGGAVTLSGEFDTAGVGAFVSATAGLCDAPRPHDVVLYLQDLSFIDAAGLGAIVALCNTLTTAGHTLSITGATGSVRRVVECGGLAHLLISDPEPPSAS